MVIDQEVVQRLLFSDAVLLDWWLKILDVLIQSHKSCQVIFSRIMLRMPISDNGCSYRGLKKCSCINASYSVKSSKFKCYGATNLGERRNQGIQWFFICQHNFALDRKKCQTEPTSTKNFEKLEFFSRKKWLKRMSLSIDDDWLKPPEPTPEDHRDAANASSVSGGEQLN